MSFSYDQSVTEPVVVEVVAVEPLPLGGKRVPASRRQVERRERGGGAAVV